MPNAATNLVVELDELLEFVRSRHHAILMTFRSDGTPQASPVICGVDGSGRILVSTFPKRAKMVNVRRTPKAGVLVLSDEFGGAWVQIDGSAEAIDLPDAIEPLVDYHRSVSGEHPDWEEYRETMRQQGKSLIRLTPQRWSPIARAGFRPRPV